MSKLSHSQKIIKATLISKYDQIYCCGNWTLDGIDKLEKQLKKFSWSEAVTIIFNGSSIEKMDTAGAWLLFRTLQTLELAGHTIIRQEFCPKHSDLLEMMTNHAANYEPTIIVPPYNILERIGRITCVKYNELINFLAFIGETFIVFFQAILSPTHIRWNAIFANLYSAGLTALPIIGLLTFLIGVVLAYQGGSQLDKYGANILIVDLVGITLLRELAPLITAIIVAGRTGSAYTAQIGTMRVTNEIDALRTIGISPMELLVLPKLLALIILMPLLSAYADIMGILGGMLISKLSFGVSMTDFIERLPKAVSLTNYIIGIAKAPFFAAAIALIASYQGFKVKGGAESVGKQVTTSVVQAIFLVIVIDAVFAMLFNFLGIGFLK
jgi:phospholipid/cholesterol/gamma-HCH transport system permease protein